MSVDDFSRRQQPEFEAWMRTEHVRLSLQRSDEPISRTYYDERTELMWSAWKMAIKFGDRCFSGCVRSDSVAQEQAVCARILTHFRSLARMFESKAEQDNTEVALVWAAAARSLLRVCTGAQRGCLEVE